MTEDARKSLKDVIAGVQLIDVRLQESLARTRVRDAGSLPKPHLAVSHGTKVIHRLGDGFLVGAKLSARVDAAEDGADLSEPRILIEVTFVLSYLLPNVAHFSDEVLEEFAAVNSVFNVWPYWREHVQTMAAKMSLPPLVLPVFRIVATGQPSKGDSAGRNTVRKRLRRPAVKRRLRRSTK